jgi:hypothetical protein
MQSSDERLTKTVREALSGPHVGMLAKR